MATRRRKRQIVRDVRIDEVSFCPQGIHKGARVMLIKAKGAPAPSAADSARALAAIDTLAEELRKATPALTREQAIAQVIAKHPELYAGYEALRRADREAALAKSQAARAAVLQAIEKAAAERRAREPQLTHEQAVAAVLQDEPRWYAAYSAAAQPPA